MKKMERNICPKIRKKLSEMKELFVMFQPHFSGGSEVKVFRLGSQFVVNLQKRGLVHVRDGI